MIEELAFSLISLDRLGSGYDGHPLLNVLSCGIALLTEGVKVELCSLNISVKAEQQIRTCNISRCVTLSCVSPVDNVRRTVLGYNDIGGVEISVAHLFMLGHTLKTSVKIVTGGSVKIRVGYLSVHLILKLVKERTGL